MTKETGALMTEEKETSAVEEEHESSPMLTMDDYLQFEEEAFRTLNHGDIVDGVVVRVDPDEVLVDVGAKAEGVISNKELGFRGEADSIDLEPGDQIKVYVLQSENEEGNVVLSLRRARAETTWLTAADKQAAGEVMEAEVREQNKGGLIVNVLGLRGFLPSSQVARAYSGNLEQLVSQRIPVKILEVNRKRNRLIVSQKAAEDEDRARRRDDLFGRLGVGDTVKGTVSGLTTYGAFVDIGGADGLIHISELSWDRVSKVSDVLQVGDEVSVKVIKLDADQSRISLSLRQLQQDPWEQVVASLPGGVDRQRDRHQDQEVRRLPADRARHRGAAPHLGALLGPRRQDRGRAQGRRRRAGEGHRGGHRPAADLPQPEAADQPARGLRQPRAEGHRLRRRGRVGSSPARPSDTTATPPTMGGVVWLSQGCLCPATLGWPEMGMN